MSVSTGQSGREDNHGKGDDAPFSSKVSSDHRHANKPTDSPSSLFAEMKEYFLYQLMVSKLMMLLTMICKVQICPCCDRKDDVITEAGVVGWVCGQVGWEMERVGWGDMNY